ncbi:hypothetical protein MXB_5218, partial [Myxobolus squamalis]
ILVCNKINKNQIKLLRQNLREKLIVVRDQSGIKKMFTTVFSQIQSQINTSQTTPKLKIGVLGFEECLSLFLQEMVLFNLPKLTDIIENTQILYIPLGVGKISKYFIEINSLYSSFFNDDEWLSSCDNNSTDVIKMIDKMLVFIHGNTVPYLLPISTICLKKAYILGYLTYFNNIRTTEENSPQIIKIKSSILPLLFQHPISENVIPVILSSQQPIKPKKIGFLRSRPRSLFQSEIANLSINYWVASPTSNIKNHEKTEKYELKLSNKGDIKLATIFRNNLSIDKFFEDRSEYLQITILKSILGNVEIDGIVWDGIKYFTVSPRGPASLKNIYFGLPST